jgi:hypothetical protein
MANMVAMATTDDPLSPGAEPPPHPQSAPSA